jgi:hypothetical protein
MTSWNPSAKIAAVGTPLRLMPGFGSRLLAADYGPWSGPGRAIEDGYGALVTTPIAFQQPSDNRSTPFHPANNRPAETRNRLPKCTTPFGPSVRNKFRFPIARPTSP